MPSPSPSRADVTAFRQGAPIGWSIGGLGSGSRAVEGVRRSSSGGIWTQQSDGHLRRISFLHLARWARLAFVDKSVIRLTADLVADSMASVSISIPDADPHPGQGNNAPSPPGLMSSGGVRIQSAGATTQRSSPILYRSKYEELVISFRINSPACKV